jgi:hypothetical protein
MTRDVSSSLATGQDGLSKTDDELKQQATYEAIGYSFGNTEAAPWSIVEGSGYPKLFFMDGTPVVSTVTFTVQDVLTVPIVDAVVTLGATTNAANNYVFTNIAAGTYSYVVDKAGYDTVSGSVTVGTGNVTEEVTMHSSAPALVAPVITTTSLPAGTVGTAYSETLTATGDEPIVWTKYAGNLPAGLSLSAAGIISGTPTAAVAIANFTVEATNSAGSDTKLLSITINDTSTIEPPLAVETQGIASLQIYPNPVINGQLTIDNGQLNAGDKVEIYNVNGTLVETLRAASLQTTINIGHLPTGVYIVKVGNKVAKVVKQ